MTTLLAQAITKPIPKEAEQFEQSELRLLVSCCRELQLSTGGEPFFLAARTAGRIVSVDHATAARWLKFLCRLKILKLEEKGRMEGRKASPYLYLG